MERHEALGMMRELKLSGMRAAYDDVMRSGLQHKRSAAEILGDLLKAEVTEKTARSIRYQMSAAKFPVMKTLASTIARSTRIWCAICMAGHLSSSLATPSSLAGPVPGNPISLSRSAPTS